EYPWWPTFDPDSCITLSDLSDPHPITATPTGDPQAQIPTTPFPNKPPHWPFSNKTIQGFMAWLNNGNTTKSESEANALVQDWVLSPDFHAKDMANF
ncbi:hypothetical protein P691DRAFT_636967, partial [Macrolepiota fuliginosa MF-IS2]